jgi:uncharacterized membrane-anchored protein
VADDSGPGFVAGASLTGGSMALVALAARVTRLSRALLITLVAISHWKGSHRREIRAAP